MAAKQVSILFADVQGFTKLRGAQFDAFVKNVMGPLAQTASVHHPRILGAMQSFSYSMQLIQLPNVRLRCVI